MIEEELIDLGRTLRLLDTFEVNFKLIPDNSKIVMPVEL